MTDPKDPDWGFPEVDPPADQADPTSTELPASDDLLDALGALEARATSDGPFDTGSDAWWRAQAAAQRAAASTEPPVAATPPARPPIDAPPPLVQPQVLLPETPAPVFKPVPPPPAQPAAPLAPPAPPAVPPAPPAAPLAPPALPVTPAAPVPPQPLDQGWLPPDLGGGQPPSGPPKQAPAPVAPALSPEPVAPSAAVPPAPVAAPEPPSAPVSPVAPPAVEVPPASVPLTPAARRVHPNPPPVRPAVVVPPAPEVPAERPAAPPIPPAVTRPTRTVLPDHEELGVVPPPSTHDTTEIPPYAPPAAQDFYEGLRYEEEPKAVGRRRALLGALLAVAGVALGIGALLLFNDDDEQGGPALALPTHGPSAAATPTAETSVTPSPQPTAAATPTVTPTSASSPTIAPVVAPKLPVTVLNNSRVSGLAARAKARFEAGGWQVPATGNYKGGTVATTTVYYAPGQLASAQRFARQFGIGRVLPRFSGLPGHGLTVVLTRDYA